MANQNKEEQMDLFEIEKPVIKGYPELRWTGKRPFKFTHFFPAQLRERYGSPSKDGWFNKIYWGDNLQVMSHLLKEYRGKINMIYIDPPFDSKADYKKTIKLKGKKIQNDSTFFEEKQYGDIWTNDEYLQFMYERLSLLKELLADEGSIYVHCDWHKSHQLRSIMDEVFGPDKFINEIVWCYKSGGAGDNGYAKKHDTILLYSKTSDFYFNPIKEKSYMYPWSGENPAQTYYKDDKGRYTLVSVKDYWTDIGMIATSADERQGYPTQKPEGLLDRMIEVSCPEGGIVFDCFMGSGTTQAVAYKKNRRFIGADINLGAVQTTCKRLLNLQNNKDLKIKNKIGFELYNVNNYEIFKNPLEAKEILIEALNIQKFNSSNIFDGQLDGRNVKILPVDRIATRIDLGELVSNLPYKLYEKTKDEKPNDPVDKITLVCMGHEPDLAGSFRQLVGKYEIDVEILDILKNKKELEFKRDSEANIVLEDGKLLIKEFYPMNLLQKLSIQKEEIDNWKQLVELIKIDYNYDGKVFKPQITDIPEKNGLVKGEYDIPKNHGIIKIIIMDLLYESLEEEIK